MDIRLRMPRKEKAYSERSASEHSVFPQPDDQTGTACANAAAAYLKHPEAGFRIVSRTVIEFTELFVASG